jgi:hypothetical protein
LRSSRSGGVAVRPTGAPQNGQNGNSPGSSLPQFGHVATHRVSPKQGALVWRVEGMTTREKPPGSAGGNPRTRGRASVHALPFVGVTQRRCCSESRGLSPSAAPRGVVLVMDQVVQVGVRAKWPLWCPSIHECLLSRPDVVIRRVTSPLAAASREPGHSVSPLKVRQPMYGAVATDSRRGSPPALRPCLQERGSAIDGRLVGTRCLFPCGSSRSVTLPTPTCCGAAGFVGPVHPFAAAQRVGSPSDTPRWVHLSPSQHPKRYNSFVPRPRRPIATSWPGSAT